MSAKSPVYLIISLLGALFFIPFLGHYHLFDWDEINFAESAREMLVTGDFLTVTIGYEPFWEKPPLFIWLQALCMKIFGISEFSARLPNALTGIITLNLLYYLGKSIRNHFTGIFWVIAYGASLAPSVYYRSGIIDPVFNLFIFIAVYHLFRAETGNGEKINVRIHMLLTGVFAGLAVLTKGPVALLIIGLLWFIRLLMNPRHVWNGWLNAGLALLGCLLVMAIWVVPEALHNGAWFFKEFYRYQMILMKGQMEWHNQPWFYHILVLLILCFPASILAIPQLFRNTEYSGNEKIWSVYMRILFWVVLIIFSAVSTKIIHYSSLCWFPLGWFAGNALSKWHTHRAVFAPWMKIPLMLIIFMLSLAVTAVSLILAEVPLVQPLSALIRDASFQDVLSEPSSWSGWEAIIGIAFLLIGSYVVLTMKKKGGTHPGWIFALTGAFSVAAAAILVPKAEASLQGAYIREIQRVSNHETFTDIWGFKSYAQFYYGNVTPQDMNGPWNRESSQYRDYPNPKTTARQHWLMNHTGGKNVYIFTRSVYNPNEDFRSKFRLQKNLGAYKLWTRKDSTQN